MPVQYDIGWVDIAFAVVLLFSILLGLVRGVVYEVLSLVGWVVAYVVAQMFSSDVAQHIRIGEQQSALNAGIAFACTFFVTLIVWGLGVRLIRLLVRATPLSALDRLLGAVFGVLRGALVLLVVATVVAMTASAQSPHWRNSHSAGWANAALQELKPLLPETVARHIAS